MSNNQNRLIWSRDDLLSLKETSEIEFKKAAGKDGKGRVPDNLWETYSAFANTDGGEIFLGVEQLPSGKFELTGIEHADKVTQDLFNTAANKSKVSVNLLQVDDVYTFELEGVNIIKVNIRRASRKQRPVFIDGNPLKSFKRLNEGDYQIPEDEIKRLLGEQQAESADARILPNYTLADLDNESIKAYRNMFSALRPGHVFLQETHQEFLRQIGAWARDRESGREGVTLAGLLMFGKLRPLHEELPYFILDYREVHDVSEDRWADRVTTDFNGADNLYDFYRRVYPKLVADVKVPFKLEQATRRDDTPIHEALRETLVNSLVHADYGTPISIRITKTADMFSFRNPGAMRIPLEQAMRGGDSDCRNRLIQKMFQLVGAAEQAGSGVLKIYTNWKQQHWLKPRVIEGGEPAETTFELHMRSLLSPETIQILEKQFGSRFTKLPQVHKTILAAAVGEYSVDYRRIKEICSTEHPAEISKALRLLVEEGFLIIHGAGRNTTYSIDDSGYNDFEAPLKDEENQYSNETLVVHAQSSQGLGSSSQGLGSSSQGLGSSSQGLLITTRQSEVNANMELQLVSDILQLKKVSNEKLYDIIVGLCAIQPQSVMRLSALVKRKADYLKNDVIPALINSGRIQYLHPENLTHPKQAYVTPDLIEKLQLS